MSIDKYTNIIRPVISVYFRGIDQTDPQMQQEMINYVSDLEAMDQFGTAEDEVVQFCWVRDFQRIEEEYANTLGFDVLQNLTFLEKLDLALKNP